MGEEFDANHVIRNFGCKVPPDSTIPKLQEIAKDKKKL